MGAPLLRSHRVKHSAVCLLEAGLVNFRTVSWSSQVVVLVLYTVHCAVFNVAVFSVHAKAGLV